MNIDWGQVGGAATAAGVVVGALLRLWGAIKKRFDRVEVSRTKQMAELRTHGEAMLAEHEVQDKARHVDNLSQFKDINRELVYMGKALVALGWRNGSNGHVDKSAS